MNETLEQMQQLVDDFRDMVPTLVVHPADEPAMRRATDPLLVRPTIRTNEWAVEPGEVMIFTGLKRMLNMEV